MMKTVLKLGLFQIDGLEPIIGYYDPTKNWNGWACPYFRKEDIDNWISNCKGLLGAVDFLAAKQGAKAAYVFRSNISDDIEIFEAEMRDHEGLLGQEELFPIGAYSWIWREVGTNQTVWTMLDEAGNNVFDPCWAYYRGYHLFIEILNANGEALNSFLDVPRCATPLNTQVLVEIIDSSGEAICNLCEYNLYPDIDTRALDLYQTLVSLVPHITKTSND